MKIINNKIIINYIESYFSIEKIYLFASLNRKWNQTIKRYFCPMQIKKNKLDILIQCKLDRNTILNYYDPKYRYDVYDEIPIQPVKPKSETNVIVSYLFKFNRRQRIFHLYQT